MGLLSVANMKYELLHLQKRMGSSFGGGTLSNLVSEKQRQDGCILIEVVMFNRCSYLIP